MSKTQKVISFLTMLVLVVIGAFLIYVNDDYDANNQALEAMKSDDKVQVTGDDPLYFFPSTVQRIKQVLFSIPVEK